VVAAGLVVAVARLLVATAGLLAAMADLLVVAFALLGTACPFAPDAPHAAATITRTTATIENLAISANGRLFMECLWVVGTEIPLGWLFAF
jgi:hypothetical protein